MDTAQRWDICEIIAYAIFKYLWLSVFSPERNSDDRWFDFKFDDDIYSFTVQVKSVNIRDVNYARWLLKYKLKVNNNNILHRYSISNPYRKSILILIVVPENEWELLKVSVENLIINCKVYRLNTFNNSNNNEYVTINIPIVNQIFEWWDSNLSNILEKWKA
jgi:hypothetical protein